MCLSAALILLSVLVEKCGLLSGDNGPNKFHFIRTFFSRLFSIVSICPRSLALYELHVKDIDLSRRNSAI